MYPAPVKAYHAPTTVARAVQILAAQPRRSLVLAGGQSALQLLKSRQYRPEVLVDLGQIPELRTVRYPTDHGTRLVIGSLVRYREIARDPVISARWPALSDAARLIGDLQVRNRGTLGGNLAYADLATDMPPVAVCLGAELVLVGPGGQRTLPAEKFFLDSRKTALRAGELLRDVRFPVPPARTGSAYDKYGISAGGRPVVGVAARLTLDSGGTCSAASFVVGGIPPRPARARSAEKLLVGQRPDPQLIARAAETAAAEVPTHSDLRASAEYRRQLVAVYGERVLVRALARAQGG